MDKPLDKFLLLWYNRAIKQNDYGRKGGCFMGEKGYYQCRSCGFIHKEKIKFNINDLYIDMICPKCKKKIPHLWVGEKPEDIYLYFDNTLDPRYFNYNKTIQND
jgi:hypothetical protein